jgi:DNA-binding winged helix-turn-helix (wHTH) protein
LGEDRRLIQNIPGRGYRLTPKWDMPAARAGMSMAGEER